MSSVYHVLCLSHDPASIAGEYDYAEAAADAITAGVEGHLRCDLLIGRYSYPLIEVGCPPSTGEGRPGQHRCYPHSLTEWVDVAWLRILAAARECDTELMRALTAEPQLAHWSRERLWRLRDQLGIELAARADRVGESG